MSKQVKVKERRLRIRRSNEVKEGKILIHEKIANELEIKDKAEIVVGGKKKLVLDAIISTSIPEDQVFINSDLAKINGIADNTIATIRRPLKT